MRVIASIDLETTGTKVATDRIVQIGIHYPNKERPNVEILVDPGISIPAAATAVHGITNSMVRGRPPFSVNAPHLLEAIEGCDLVGYNILGFDIPLLFEEFRRVGIDWDPSAHRIIDVYVLYMSLNPRTLEAAVKQYCGRGHDQAHSAHADAKAAFDVLFGMLKHHPELPRAVPDLAALTTPEGRVDVAGKLVRNAAGEVCYNFGQHKGVPVVDEPDYAEWMLSTDFPEQTQRIVREILEADGYEFDEEEDDED